MNLRNLLSLFSFLQVLLMPLLHLKALTFKCLHLFLPNQTNTHEILEQPVTHDDVDRLVLHLHNGRLIRVSIENNRSPLFLVLFKFTHYLRFKRVPPDRYLYGPSWVAVLCYVNKILHYSNEEHDTVKQTIRRLAYLGDERKWEIFSETILYEFMPRVQKFFTIPSRMYHLNQNEILAGFMDFLLQIWNTEANKSCEEKERYAFLKELKYLLTFLGDVPFQCTQLEDLKTLLAEFEIIASEAGNFTFCHVLATHPDVFPEFYAGRDALLRKFELLNEKIKQYCITFSKLPMHVIPRVPDAIDSFFIVDSLLEDVENLITQRLQVIIDDEMEDQIESLYEELKLSRTFLKHSKTSKEIENHVLKECFITIRDIAYEAEYLINSHTVGNIPTWYLKLRLPVVIQRLKLNESRHQKIKKDREFSQVTKDFTREISLQPMRTATMVVGFEESKTKILGDIFGSEEALKIISLIGMPGLGKTTVAMNLFDNTSVRNYFDRRGWCVISQMYDKRKVFVEILLCLISKGEKEKVSAMDDEALGLKIYQSLMGYRYLIIIDDIWNSSTWDDLRIYLPNENRGSRIMLTSRSKEAAPNESIFHSLPLLSEVECLNLLVKKVFLNKPCPPELLSIGKRIAKRCNGLPLAVVSIAGILANSEKQEDVWEKVERNLDSLITDGPNGCRKVLEFSYEDLPDHLKLCYLYLGTFLEDTEIPARKLIWLWIAERFIQREEPKSLEDIAMEYLSNLVNRNLVLIAKRKSDGGIKACGIHDLLREMCLKKAVEENFMKSTNNNFSMYERHRRLRVNCTSSLLSRHFGLHCRSFSGHLPAHSSRVPQMPLLRVMDMFPHRVPQIPRVRSMVTHEPGDEWNMINIPVHLRYLHTAKRLLPFQLASNLVNLEFLVVDNSLVGGQITFSIILKMVKLRHLKIRKFQLEIGEVFDSIQTINLQSLSGITFFHPSDEKILKYCPYLRKLRCLCYDSLCPDFGSLTKLESLRINFVEPFRGDLTKDNFPSTIRKLNLRKIRFPGDTMSIIGRLPNLEVLKLSQETSVGDEWETRDGEFQKLRFLKLEDFKFLKEWIACSEHFPELQILMLVRCQKLQDIPSDLGNIPTLEIIEVHDCSYEASISAVQIEQEQHEFGNYELKVIIKHYEWSKEQLLLEYKERIDGEGSE